MNDQKPFSVLIVHKTGLGWSCYAIYVSYEKASREATELYDKGEILDWKINSPEVK
jgi:hypothetical protein